MKMSILIVSVVNHPGFPPQKKIQCATCDTIFTEIDFQDHVCEYDENRNYIDMNSNNNFESEVIRLLKRNGEQMISMLKDQFKINVEKRPHYGPFDCHLCDRTFVYHAGLQRHLEKHKREINPMKSTVIESLKAIVKCLKCGQVFSSVQIATEHFVDNHKKKLIDNFSTKFLKIIGASAILQCEYCNVVFTKTGDLFHHMSHHCSRKGYDCTSCKISVSTSKEIVNHWQNDCISMEFESTRKINLIKYFVCNVCEEYFVRLEDLHHHRFVTLHFMPRINRKTNILEISCDKCVFFTTTILKYISHHNETHNCKVVSAKKQNVTSLKPRPHLCEVCGKSYTQSSHLWQHLRFHQGIKPFVCPVDGCDRKFTIRPDLNDHIRKCHTGERPYHCLLCGKRFLTGSVFYQHRLIHRGERRYGCEECGKRFYRADALKNHQRIHSGIIKITKLSKSKSSFELQMWLLCSYSGGF